MLEHRRAYGFITSPTECKETKTTLLSFFSSVLPQDTPLHGNLRLQSCGYTECSITLERGMVASLGEYWLLIASIFRKLTVYYWHT